MNKIKVLALFGKSGAGKDTIQRWMMANLPNLSGIISCTTRPKREYEVDGKDYYFMSVEDFLTKVNNNEMLEHTIFNNWYYGTSINELATDKVNLGVFNVAGVRTILQDERLEVLPVFITVDDKTRLMRGLTREQHPDCYEICRRFLTDEEDFKELNFHYVVFDNSHERDFFNIHRLPEVAAFLGNTN